MSAFLVCCLPATRIVQERLYFRKLLCRVDLTVFRNRKNIVPSAQRMQCHTVIAKRLLGFGKDAVVENHSCMRAGCTRFADRIDKG